jgi:hypothetical protein
VTNRVSRGLAVGVLMASLGLAAAADKSTTSKSDTFADKTPKRPPVIIAPPPAEVVAEAIRAEMDAYARRLDVCTRLRQIAIETSDDSLLNQTDELERQAAAIYQARVARLGINSKDAPKPEAGTERKLGGGVDPLKVGPPTPAGGASR